MAEASPTTRTGRADFAKTTRDFIEVENALVLARGERPSRPTTKIAGPPSTLASGTPAQAPVEYNKVDRPDLDQPDLDRPDRMPTEPRELPMPMKTSSKPLVAVAATLPLLPLLALLALLSLVACKRPPAPTRVDAVEGIDTVDIDGGASLAEPGEGSAAHVDFVIVAVHALQKATTNAPWHEPGGAWTFFDAKTTDGTRFGFGFDATKPKGAMAFGKVMLTVPDREQGKRLVSLFAERFKGTVPPEKTPQPLTFEPFSAVFLATDAKRTGGGYSGSGGGYYATKLFLQRPGIEAEVFFNFSLKAKAGVFSEKDPDYATDMVRFLARDLRDGKPVQRTRATDPSLVEAGPRITFTRTLPGKPFGFDPARERFWMKEEIDGGGTKLVSHSLNAKQAGDPKELFRLPDDVGMVKCAVDRCAVEGVKHKEPGVHSSEDPRTIYVADRKTWAPRKIEGPWSAKAGLSIGESIAPDGELVLVSDLVPNPAGPQPFKHVLFVVDRAGKTRGPIDLGPESWEPIAIEPAAKGSHILVRKGSSFDKDSKLSYVSVDPTSAAITPAILPATSTGPSPEGRSPGGKRTFVCTDDAIVVRELATGKESRFPIHEDDRDTIKERCVSWASDRYLLYRSDFTAFLDVETMKLNEAFAEKPERPTDVGSLDFDKKFENVVETSANGTRVGRITVR